jgi:hypothetical protein
MANQKAYSYPIVPRNSDPHKRKQNGTDENANLDGSGVTLVHQSSPTWVVTFVRWQYRDTLRTQTSTPLEVRRTLVVENDCIAVQVSDDKGSLTPSCQLTLVETDVNYETEVEPGDFMFVNMLNWEVDARRVGDAARAGTPINGVRDGFKGMFKVQSCRKFVNVEPNSGVKTLIYKIDGFAFTEFNNTIYFNPNLVNQKNLANVGLYIADVAPAWASFVSRDGRPQLQEVISFLIQNFLGSSQNPDALKANGLVVSPNLQFSMPTLVGRLLGTTNSQIPNATDYNTVTAAKDIYRFVFGIQQYASSGHLTLASGMNPINLNGKPTYPGFEYTSTYVPGTTLLKPEYWNQVKLWSIINQYTNSPLNEIYTCFKIAPNNRVMPTMTFRQIPFTSEDFTGQMFGTQDAESPGIAVTKFLNLPRWKIDSAFILNMDIGRDEAARINFVQFYAKSNFNDKGVESSGETAAINYVFDKTDIQRSGLRPYVVQNQFDDLPDTLVKRAPEWARILGDALIGGHLKMNGTFNCIGIVEPIAVGDNAEVDGVVYHIENVTHNCSINPSTGVKTFRTSLKVSHGVSVNSNAQGTKYAEMTYTDGYADRQHDFNNQQILPGVSESQDVVYRPSSLDVSSTKEAASRGSASTNAPFPQPSTTKNTPNKGN